MIYKKALEVMKFHFFYTQGRPLSAGDWDTQTLFFLSTGIGSSTTGGSHEQRIGS